MIGFACRIYIAGGILFHDRKTKEEDYVGGDDDEESCVDFDKESKQQRQTDKYLHKHYHSYPDEEVDEQMDINEIARRPQRRRPDQIWNTYRDTLMFSEWLVEVRRPVECEVKGVDYYFSLSLSFHFPSTL